MVHLVSSKVKLLLKKNQLETIGEMKKKFLIFCLLNTTIEQTPTIYLIIISKERHSLLKRVTKMSGLKISWKEEKKLIIQVL